MKALQLKTYLLLILLMTISMGVALPQEEAKQDAPTVEAKSEAQSGDPTVPSQKLLKLLPQSSDVNAQNLLDSAKRLYEAGLFEDAARRIEQLMELKDASLQVQDEAAIWWASIAPDYSQRTGIGAVNSTGVGRKVMKPLPTLPKITLKAIILSTPDRGTALLDLEEEQILLMLKSEEDRQRVLIPVNQFGDILGADGMNPKLIPERNTSGEQKQKQAVGFEISLECSFLHKGVFYNLEAFNADTIMLRALPHNKLVLVRMGKTK